MPANPERERRGGGRKAGRGTGKGEDTEPRQVRGSGLHPCPCPCPCPCPIFFTPSLAVGVRPDTALWRRMHLRYGFIPLPHPPGGHGQASPAHAVRRGHRPRAARGHTEPTALRA